MPLIQFDLVALRGFNRVMVLAHPHLKIYLKDALLEKHKEALDNVC